MMPVKQDLNVYRGDRPQLRILVEDDIGNPLTLSGEWAAQIREQFTSAVAVDILVDTSNQSVGELMLTIPGDDFELLDKVKAWVWDLQGSAWGTIVKGNLVVHPDVTRSAVVDGGYTTHLVLALGPDELGIIASAIAGPRGPKGDSVVWEQVTQAEYDELSPPDPNTLYVVVG